MAGCSAGRIKRKGGSRCHTDMGWMRLCLLAATTFASVRDLRARAEGECPKDHCASASEEVAAHHVLLPLALPCAVLAFAHAPNLMLRSRWRVACLWNASGHLAVLWAALWACAAAYRWLAPAHAYALSLHLALLILDNPAPQALSVAPSLHFAARHLASAALLPWAAYAGPPLPVVDTPSSRGACGAAAHLLGWAAAETLGRAFMAALRGAVPEVNCPYR
jgi:hypothetical protein